MFLTEKKSFLHVLISFHQQWKVLYKNSIFSSLIFLEENGIGKKSYSFEAACILFVPILLSFELEPLMLKFKDGSEKVHKSKAAS